MTNDHWKTENQLKNITIEISFVECRCFLHFFLYFPTCERMRLSNLRCFQWSPNWHSSVENFGSGFCWASLLGWIKKTRRERWQKLFQGVGTRDICLLIQLRVKARSENIEIVTTENNESPLKFTNSDRLKSGNFM